jgi:thioredoxin-related protein
MNKNIYLITLFILIISGIFACKNQQNEQSQYVPVTQFDPNRDAAKDITDAIVEAKRTNKRILLDVGGDWCIWCHKLDSFFRENQDINEFLHENFIVVKINYSKENKNEAVLSQYPKVAGYPHLFVLDSDGKLLHSQNTGDLESGDHHDREKVFSFLKTWTPSSK